MMNRLSLWAILILLAALLAACASPAVDAQPVATSRGPELHATDPTTVSLDSGGLQFVEFFEFW